MYSRTMVVATLGVITKSTLASALYGINIQSPAYSISSVVSNRNEEVLRSHRAWVSNVKLVCLIVSKQTFVNQDVSSVLSINLTSHARSLIETSD